LPKRQHALLKKAYGATQLNTANLDSGQIDGQNIYTWVTEPEFRLKWPNPWRSDFVTLSVFAQIENALQN